MYFFFIVLDLRIIMVTVYIGTCMAFRTTFAEQHLSLTENYYTKYTYIYRY